MTTPGNDVEPHERHNESASQVNPERDAEADAITRYREALAAGLSDHEAREDGWPS